MEATAVGMRPEDRDRRGKSMVAAGVAHQTRTHCFTILGERVASPAEIARQLRADVTTIGYHVRTLKAWGLVEEVDQRPVRGSVEHFYRATKLPEISDEEEEDLTPEERKHFAETVLTFYAADAVRAIDTGLLYARTDHVMTRYVYNVDEQGWRDAAEVYAECWARIGEIKVEAEQRLEEKKAQGSDEEPIRMLTHLSLFELPLGD